MNFNYYDRPYNADHVQRRLYEGLNSSSDPRRPYSNKMFEAIFEDYEQVITNEQLGSLTQEPAINGFHDSVWRDRYLEYTDWQKHQTARKEWLAEQAEVEYDRPAEETLLQPPVEFDNDYKPAANQPEAIKPAMINPAVIRSAANKPAAIKPAAKKSVLEMLHQPRTFRPGRRQ